eukprot:GHVP01032242.1.p1 GENE.GHVP01032242.1~~GHVP01032242.1.p1  ORF type:complete len:971 (+),score=208.90 GHVP01032242.1:739-3651(+)
MFHKEDRETSEIFNKKCQAVISVCKNFDENCDEEVEEFVTLSLNCLCVLVDSISTPDPILKEAFYLMAEILMDNFSLINWGSVNLLSNLSYSPCAIIVFALHCTKEIHPDKNKAVTATINGLLPKKTKRPILELAVEIMNFQESVVEVFMNSPVEQKIVSASLNILCCLSALHASFNAHNQITESDLEEILLEKNLSLLISFFISSFCWNESSDSFFDNSSFGYELLTTTIVAVLTESIYSDVERITILNKFRKLKELKSSREFKFKEILTCIFQNFEFFSIRTKASCLQLLQLFLTENLQHEEIFIEILIKTVTSMTPSLIAPSKKLFGALGKFGVLGPPLCLNCTKETEPVLKEFAAEWGVERFIHVEAETFCDTIFEIFSNILNSISNYDIWLLNPGFYCSNIHDVDSLWAFDAPDAELLSAGWYFLAILTPVLHLRIHTLVFQILVWIQNTLKLPLQADDTTSEMKFTSISLLFLHALAQQDGQDIPRKNLKNFICDFSLEEMIDSIFQIVYSKLESQILYEGTHRKVFCILRNYFEILNLTSFSISFLAVKEDLKVKFNRITEIQNLCEGTSFPVVYSAWKFIVDSKIEEPTFFSGLLSNKRKSESEFPMIFLNAMKISLLEIQLMTICAVVKRHLEQNDDEKENSDENLASEESYLEEDKKDQRKKIRHGESLKKVAEVFPFKGFSDILLESSDNICEESLRLLCRFAAVGVNTGEIVSFVLSCAANRSLSGRLRIVSLKLANKVGENLSKFGCTKEINNLDIFAKIFLQCEKMILEEEENFFDFKRSALQVLSNSVTRRLICPSVAIEKVMSFLVHFGNSSSRSRECLVILETLISTEPSDSREALIGQTIFKGLEMNLSPRDILAMLGSCSYQKILPSILLSCIAQPTFPAALHLFHDSFVTNKSNLKSQKEFKSLLTSPSFVDAFRVVVESLRFEKENLDDLKKKQGECILNLAKILKILF